MFGMQYETTIKHLCFFSVWDSSAEHVKKIRAVIESRMRRNDFFPVFRAPTGRDNGWELCDEFNRALLNFIDLLRRHRFMRSQGGDDRLEQLHGMGGDRQDTDDL